VIPIDLDTLIEVETPEGILLELHPAGLVPRLYAFLIDLAVRWTILSVAATILSRLGGIGVAFWFIGIFLLEWLYPVAFELYAGGATPGKRALGLMVVMDNALPVTPAASVIRNLLRVADFLPFAYGVGIVAILCRADFKRLGDLDVVRFGECFPVHSFDARQLDLHSPYRHCWRYCLSIINHR